MTRRPSFSIVTTAAEPVELLCAFVAHHLEAGAETIHLYLDRPDPVAEALLGRHPQVRLNRPAVARALHWGVAQGFRRPLSHVTRQRINATRAYRRCTSDWLVHIDADEFLYADRPLADILADVPQEADFAVIGSSERVLLRPSDDPADNSWPPMTPAATIFDGAFRIPVPGLLPRMQALFAPHANFFTRSGLLGHTVGKAATRTGRPVAIDLHTPFPRRPNLPLREWQLAQGRPVPIRLAHFDGLTPLHWMLKLISKQDDLRLLPEDQARRIFNGRHPGRQAQMRVVWDSRQDRDALARVTSGALSIGPRQRDRLLAEGALAMPAFDLPTVARAAFPDAVFDFSAMAFDGRLRRDRHPVIERTGFAG
jgi:hypothetical protein